MNFALISVLLSTFVVGHLRPTAVAESPQQVRVTVATISMKIQVII